MENGTGDDDDPTQAYNVNATDGHEYGASRTPLDAPIGSLREKWRVLPHFLKLRGLMKQHIDSFDHFVSVEMKQIVQVSLLYIHLICIIFFDDVNNKYNLYSFSYKPPPPLSHLVQTLVVTISM